MAYSNQRASADENLALADRLMMRQRRQIEHLERTGADTESAKWYLDKIIKRMAVFERHRATMIRDER